MGCSQVAALVFGFFRDSITIIEAYSKQICFKVSFSLINIHSSVIFFSALSSVCNVSFTNTICIGIMCK